MLLNVTSGTRSNASIANHIPQKLETLSITHCYATFTNSKISPTSSLGSAIAIMNDRSQTLQSLKQYLQYLTQDPTCSEKVLTYVREQIRILEQT